MMQISGGKHLKYNWPVGLISSLVYFFFKEWELQNISELCAFG